MKKILFFLFVSFFVLSSNAQESEVVDTYPESVLDVGVGIGSNYGIIGFKSVLGYKGNGLLVGVGSIEGKTASAIGFQLAYRQIFVSLSLATIGYYRSEVGSRLDEGLVRGTSFIVGGRVDLNKTKRLFLELGFGYSDGDHTDQFGTKIDMSSIAFNLGVGYRIGSFSH